MTHILIGHNLYDNLKQGGYYKRFHMSIVKNNNINRCTGAAEKARVKYLQFIMQLSYKLSNIYRRKKRVTFTKIKESNIYKIKEE